MSADVSSAGDTGTIGADGGTAFGAATTTAAAGHVEAAAGHPPLLLPESPPRFGPISRRLVGRLLAVLALVELVGLVLVIFADGHAARAAGLSLALPGGGLLYDACPVLFLAVAAATVVALVLWWGASAHFAIPLVWVLGVVAAVLLADGPRLWTDHGTQWTWAIPVVYGLIVALLATAVWRTERRYRRKRAMIPELNEYLRSAQLPAPISALREPDAMDAELLRWCLDFAGQPDDGLVGLDWGEQFHGGTQTRYQLNSLSWSMSLFAANYVPNAPGQIDRALRRVILKHTDLRVWRYWRTLNLVGNFDPNPDPIRRDNIMFSAFLGDVLNTYEAATGSTCFDEPGSLTFVWQDGRTFAYDHHSIVDAVRANFDASRLGFFPCEPGWSFTVCNVMGAQALRGHDTGHGTNQWDEVRGRWQQTLDEEYHTPDGSYAHIRSNHVGLSWDTGEVPGGHYFANGTHRFADILPDHARRAKALDLRLAGPKMAALSAMVDDGRLNLDLPAEPERNHARHSTLLPWNRLLGGARLTGDEQLAEAVIRSSAEKCATGKRFPERPLDVGGAALGSHMLLRWSSPLDLAALNMRGYVAPTGPVLADAPWDEVLVLLARSDDGRSLRLVLQPLDDDETVPVRLTFAGLLLGVPYVLHSDDTPVLAGDEPPSWSASADGDGRATFDAEISGRTELVLDVRRAP